MQKHKLLLYIICVLIAVYVGAAVEESVVNC